MTAFWTLLKREYLDHKGGMFWTPLIVSVVLAVLIVFSAGQILLSGGKIPHANQHATRQMENGKVTNPDGSVVETKTVTTADGKKQTTITVTNPEKKRTTQIIVNDADKTNASGVQINGISLQNMKSVAQYLNGRPEAERINGARTMGAAFAGFLLPVLLIMAIVVPFLLLASLFDERQDRSILFWKSLPVTDTQTVLSKLAANAGGGFLIATGFGLILHLLILAAASLIGNTYGFANMASMWHLPTIASAWFTWILLIVQYLLWVLPIYAWLLFVSATSPRAPFLFAFLIPGALAIIERIVTKSDFVANEFFGRLIGAPIWQAVGQLSSAGSGDMGKANQFLAKSQELLMRGFADPGLWIGLLIAAGLIYATIEMRRRKAL